MGGQKGRLIEEMTHEQKKIRRRWEACKVTYPFLNGLRGVIEGRERYLTSKRRS